MQVTCVELPTGDTVALVDGFFPDRVLQLAETIEQEFAPNNPDWTTPEAIPNRRVYTSTTPEYQQLKDYAASAEACRAVESIVGRTVWLSNMTVWTDLPGTGPLRPHRETAGEYLVQVFITDDPDGITGTTFYNEQRQVLFQLPFRNNFGWVFEGQRVLHGRQHSVAEGRTRTVVMLWYNQSL
jgi:hypothetical protein